MVKLCIKLNFKVKYVASSIPFVCTYCYSNAVQKLEKYLVGMAMKVSNE